MVRCIILIMAFIVMFALTPMIQSAHMVREALAGDTDEIDFRLRRESMVKAQIAEPPDYRKPVRDEKVLAAMPYGEYGRCFPSGYIHSLNACGLNPEMIHHIPAGDAILGGSDRDDDLLVHILIPFLKYAGDDVTLLVQSYFTAYRIDLVTKQVSGNPQS